jgi:hypothetical protein
MSHQRHPISHEEIASRAQQLWEAEGRPEGKAGEHWSRAESEIHREDELRFAGLPRFCSLLAPTTFRTNAAGFRWSRDEHQPAGEDVNG